MMMVMMIRMMMVNVYVTHVGTNIYGFKPSSTLATCNPWPPKGGLIPT